MKAITRDWYGSSKVLHLEEVERPVPGDGQVLVRVHASSLNTTDVDHMRGRPRISRIGTGMLRPGRRILGLDVAGRVEAVGGGVTRLEPGDEVWGDMSGWGAGAFAEFVCAPEPAFAPKPNVSFEVAATIPHSGILAWQGLLGKGDIKAGEQVLVNGAGGNVGPLAIQIAKSFGAEVTGVDHTGKLDFMSSVGADHVIDYTTTDFTRNGQVYDLILDIASNRSVRDFKRSLTRGGRYVSVAHSLSRFMEAWLVGGWLSRGGRRRMGIFTWTPGKREDLDELGRLVEAGKIDPPIDRTWPLEQVPDAIRHMESGLARGKLVVLI